MLVLTLLEAKGLVVSLDLDWDLYGSEILWPISPPPDVSMNDNNDGAALDSRVYKN